MRIRSDSFRHGKPIPAEFALGAPDGFGGNRNPHLAWDDVPELRFSVRVQLADDQAPMTLFDRARVPVDHDS